MKRKLLLAALCVVGALGFKANAQIVSGTTYYLQNKASGRFISSGHAWFTRSTLSPVLDYPIQLNASGDGYILKVVGSNQLGHNLFVDNGSNNAWTVTAVAGEENVYTIANGTNYLGSDGSLVLSGSLTDATSDAAKWYIRTKDDYLAMFPSASAENPVDASFYITGPSYDYTDTNRDNAWTMDGFGAGTNLSRGSGTTAINPYVVERYNGTGSIKQTLTGLKKGMYAVSVYGFYRAGNNNTAPGSTAQNAIMYVGTEEKPLKSIYDEAKPSSVSGSFDTNTSAGYVPNVRSTAGEAFANGYYKNTIYIYVENDNTDIEIGVKKEATIAEDWAIIDNWCMTYYGEEELSATEIELAASVKAYNEALAAAQAYQSVDMFDADKTVLNTAISDNTLDLSGSVTEEQLTTAAANLNAAAAAAATAAAKYAIYTTAVERTTGNTNVNLTDLVVNAGFETGTMEGWTSVDGGAQANNTNFSKMSGNHFVERWKQNVALGAGSLTHDALCLPKGFYTITAEAQNIEQYNSNAGGKGYFLCANEEKAEIGAAGTYSTSILLNDKDELTIQFLLDNCTGNWISCDNVTLTYVGEDFPAYTLVTAMMNAEVSAAQTAAAEAFQANKTISNYNALTAAIAAAQASANAYGHLTDAVIKIQAAATSVSANGGTVTEEQKEALQALLGEYSTGAIADADVLTKVAEGYDLVAPIIKTQTASSADFTLAIRNQSFEYGDMTGWTATASDDTGVRETADATYAATGSDGFYLFNTWWQGVPLTQTVEGLPNGEYTLTASVASDGATIYLIANGEHNEGIETGGTYPGKDVLQETTITFLVKDGNATIGVVGGADGTAGEHKDYVAEGYWWYKADNFRLVKNRDLTEEEQAVAPTAIALYNGETEVTEPVELTAAANTVTLTPSYTPDNATEGYLDWTSSDVSVATVSSLGEVTGVAPGTAIITATSMLDATVSASATVTVSYPETDVPADSEIANGPELSVVTYGEENLIKNGTFEYPDGFFGWTDATAGAAKLTSAKFEIVTDGDSKYLKAKASEGSTAAGSIGTAWPIEADKTYVFGYRVKANQTINDKSTYHKVTLTNTLGTETLQVSDNNTPVTAEWNNVQYKFTNSDGYAYVQFRARWLANDMSFDDFYLVEVTGEQTVGNVQYALNAIPTANIGTGAFQYSQDAIDNANALVQGEATVAEVEAAYEAVTTLNAPEATQAYNLVFNCEGHDYTGNALTLIPNPAQTQGLYGLKYLAPANVNLAQAFYFVHTTGNKYKVYAVDTDGNDRYITTQAEGYGTTWYEGIRTIDDASKAMEIEIRPNGEGLYLLWNTGANKPIAHNGNNNNDMFTNNTANFQFVETSKPSIAINTTEAGYGTIMLPFAKPLPNNGVKVYTCAAVNEKELTLTEVDAIEANKPYIIEGAWEEVLTGDAQGTALTYTDGLLTGVYTRTEAPVGSYVLQNLDNGVAFYLVEEDKDDAGAPAGSSNLYVPDNRAYLTLPYGANVRALFFPEAGDATGIAGLDALTSGSYDAIYTANGVKVNSLQKGLNVVKKGNKSYKIFVK